MAIVFPEKLSLAQLPTPLMPLDRLSEQLGGPRIWLKRDDLTGCATSGNKIRKLEFTLAHALREGCDAIITCGGLQSNHCRATALLCAQLGLHCSLILRGSKPESMQGNLLLENLAGADCHYVPVTQYQSELDNLLYKESLSLRKKGKNPWIIPTGASDGVGVWGYMNCAQELIADFERLAIQPGYVVHSTGSGGTQAGLTLGFHLMKSDIGVIGINVCDDENYFIRKVKNDIRDWQTRNNAHMSAAQLNVEALSVQVIDGYVGKGYAMADNSVYQCIADIARLEGIILDPVYTGKAFYGLTREISRGRFSDTSDIVFVHTGGTFGLFAFEEEVNQFLNETVKNT